MDEKEIVKKRTYKKINAVKARLPDEYDLAVLTHYHATRETVYGDALQIAGKYDYLTEEGTIDAICEKVQTELFKTAEVPFPGPAIGAERFTFIDLFAGIGGFRMGLQDNGGRCVFTSEWDKFSKQTYFANYGEMPFGDITKDETKVHIPQKFDILCGGFPCQPFSIAGVSKKNSLGRLHGFADEKQGNLFFHIADILETHRPRAFFLENVKNLVSHDKKNTFKVIKETILELGYSFDHRVIDGKYFVPQHRERTLMVGFDKQYFGDDIRFDFDNVNLPEIQHEIREILEENPDTKYTLSDKLWTFLQDYSKKHKEKGNGFGFGLVDLGGISRTMSARYYKDGSEILIPQPGKNPRRLTPEECAALQGYPVAGVNTEKEAPSFKIPVSDNQAYRQFGNSVVMPLIREVGRHIADIVCAYQR